jgi:hypothetical protein
MGWGMEDSIGCFGCRLRQRGLGSHLLAWIHNGRSLERHSKMRKYLWTTQISLNSDHLPITIDLEGDSPPGRSAKTLANFRFADWAGYLAETEAGFAVQPDPISCAAGSMTS